MILICRIFYFLLFYYDKYNFTNQINNMNLKNIILLQNKLIVTLISLSLFLTIFFYLNTIFLNKKLMLIDYNQCGINLINCDTDCCDSEKEICIHEDYGVSSCYPKRQK